MESRLSIEEVRQLPGAVTAEWVDPPYAAVFLARQGDEELHPANMLAVNGMFLVETVEEPGKWWMGQKREDGVIACWGMYGPLENAILGL